MDLYVPLILAIIPTILLVRYFYFQDINKPEPVGLIIKIFVIGILSVIPIILIELMVARIIAITTFQNNVIFNSFCQAFIIAGLCEEAMKLFIVRKFIFNNNHFDEIMDGIVYTIVASLGFACIENILYVIEGGVTVALMRGVTAVPLHAIASGIMGYFIGKAKFSTTNTSSLLFKGLLIAIGVHGSYNFVLFISPTYGFMYSLLIFPILILSYLKLKFYINSAVEEDLNENI